MTQIQSAAPEKPDKQSRTKFYLILSFLIPMVLMGIGFLLQKVHPFGDRQILVVDCWHQYYPFFQQLHEKLRHGGSLLFTWDSGLGSNFLPILSYYAASPLNLLAALVPDSLLREAFTVNLLLKIGCAGGFFALFLKGTFRRNDFSLCIFSVMYALCSYLLGYYWNVIWVDTVALLPLVVLGMVQLVRDGKYRLYVIALGLSLFTNFYIGMFTCIFAVLAYPCLCVFYLKPRHLAGRTLMMLVASLLGGGLAAVLLIPTYLALQLTHSVDNVFPTGWEFYENWRNLFVNLISYHEPTSKDGLPNLACGMLPLVLIGPFLRARKIRIREKVAAVLVLAFLLVSCNVNILNYLWHGMHFPNMLPFRFSFLFSFVLLTLAYRAFQLLLEERFRIWDIAAMLVLAAAVFLCSYSVQENHAVYWSFATAVLYVLIALLYFRKIFTPRLMYAALSVVLAFEMFQNVKLGTETVSTSDYPSYPSSQQYVEFLEQKIDEQTGDSFARTEMSNWFTLNDPALYNYHGLSQFSSTANESVTSFLHALGLPASEAGNRYYYAGGSPITNWFTGIQYLICRTGSLLDTAHWQMLSMEGTSTAYQNSYGLPVGFVAERSLADYEGNPNGNPFENQNELFRFATGIQEPLFTPVDVRDVGHEGVEVTRGGYGIYTYQVDAAAESRILRYNYQTQTEANLYGYLSTSNTASVTVYKDDNYQGSYSLSRQPYIFPMGTYQGNETASLSATLNEEASAGGVTVYVYQLNEALLEKAYQMLSAGGVNVTEYSDTKLCGTVNAQKDGLCYFSIPDDSGWSVQVDGETVSSVKVGGAMLAVPVTAGTHTIRLTYCPPGFPAGAAISAGSIAVLILLYVWERKRKKPLLQPVPAQVVSAQAETQEEPEVQLEQEHVPAEEAQISEKPEEEET